MTGLVWATVSNARTFQRRDPHALSYRSVTRPTLDRSRPLEDFRILEERAFLLSLQCRLGQALLILASDEIEGRIFDYKADEAGYEITIESKVLD